MNFTSRNLPVSVIIANGATCRLQALFTDADKTKRLAVSNIWYVEHGCVVCLAVTYIRVLAYISL